VEVAVADPATEASVNVVTPEVQAEAPAEKYEPTSCLCMAQEGEKHDSWCNLQVFPGGLPMAPAMAEKCNALYTADYGKIIPGQLELPTTGDHRVFLCSCGCRLRVCATGMLCALLGHGMWFAPNHAPKGIRRIGKVYTERPSC
jgi:hypothetical protein